MAWIAIADHDGGRYAPGGLGRGSARTPDLSADTLVRRGTIMVETRFSATSRPQTLLAFRHAYPNEGGFSLRALPRGGVTLAQNFGSELLHTTIPHGKDARSDLVRIIYCWDCAAGAARLTIEGLDDGHRVTRELSRACPIPLADMRRLGQAGGVCEMDSEVVFAAMADHMHPLGPLPGLGAHVPVMTPNGPVRASLLRRGDTVCTAAGDVVPILQTVRLTVPARGAFRPVRLRAPFFGLDRDTFVASHQRLVMSGSDVEYMFGTEAVLVPARCVVNDSSAFFCDPAPDAPDVVTYHHVLLPSHQAILTDGCRLESLYIGRLRRDKATLARSVLAHCRHARLPEHARPLSPVLKPFEAITLVRAKVA
ncbi:Hint domain-containing protein [Roseovarius sp. SCSIO 43702]|uniref:Hint domain-containing protein n=1 Tax=Roseovarius sp. SCSIO 43702 TaxID=2823043 RepID=UPI001C736403|nr:Hint domain-containing protein [Roseovarius sp. SCSIO 43702]QYX56143.1 Hint domain-containing protein [Roseovarius sp. SCSIO 43702]